MKALTDEKESVMSQLGVTYLNFQGLKRENETLKEQNEELRRQLSAIIDRSYTGNYEKTQNGKQKSKVPDVTTSTANEGDSTAGTRSRSRSRLNERRRSTRQVEDTHSSDRRKSLPEAELAKLQKSKDLEALFSIDCSSLRPSRKADGSGSNKTKKDQYKLENKRPNISKQRSRRSVVGGAEDGQTSDVGGRTHTKGPQETTKDFTYLTFIDVRLMCVS